MFFLSDLTHKYLIHPLFSKYLEYRIEKVRTFYKQSITTVSSEFLQENMSWVLKKTDICYLRKKHHYLNADLERYNKKINDLKAIISLSDGSTSAANGKVIKDFLMWKTGLRFSGIKNNLAYVNFVENAYYESLRVDTNALNEVFFWKKKRKKFRTKAITQPPKSLKFYSLVIGALDESRGNASVADLYEHFVEKTDIRYRHPLVRRKRGARIKLVNTDDRDFLFNKLENVQNPNEIVILSPLTLARFVFHYESALIDSAELFADIGDVDNDLLALRLDFYNEYYLAQKLREVFSVGDYRYLKNDSIAFPKDVVSKRFKRLIQYYVLNYSILTTQELRNRELSSGVSKTSQRRKAHSKV